MRYLPLTLSGPVVRVLRLIPARPGPLVDGVELCRHEAPVANG